MQWHIMLETVPAEDSEIPPYFWEHSENRSVIPWAWESQSLQDYEAAVPEI